MKKILLLLLSLGLLAGGCSMTANGNTIAEADSLSATSTWDGSLVIYHELTCVHCRELISYIKNEGIDQKLTFSYVETSDDAGYRDFYAKIQSCGVPIYQIGVPMMWDGAECYLGVDKIKNELNRQRINNE